ncbi:MAG TPA: hypothetical protein DHV16_02450 [Nitrospiraceae bacterium]|nr:MAG: hypothetical protein A2Z82_01160 [Nitrospirae bacterium GWA2_46_11]OGW25320.1 MAG: hypothetical protein A2X55_01535 [Nitrospirae bacterium GWB2_47_37]HAK88952.1 hypothetical protein [Nitrospiraceae bacterium]HCZ11122.1 hypothetical protein [Nitrospiraceae bacterium]
MRGKKVLALAVLFFFLVPVVSFAARLSETEELDKTIKKLNERQSKNLKNFEKKTKAYFFESQKPEVIEGLIKEFQPGDAVAVIVFSNLSKKSVKEIAGMKKSGMQWQAMAAKLNVKLKIVVKEVKDFRLGIG